MMSTEFAIFLAASVFFLIGVFLVLLLLPDPLESRARKLIACGDYKSAIEHIDGFLVGNDLKKGRGLSGPIAGTFFDLKSRRLRKLRRQAELRISLGDAQDVG